MTDTDLQPATLTIELPVSIKVGAAEYKQILLREPTTGEVLLAEQHLRRGISSEAMRLYYLSVIAKVSDVPLPVLNLLPVTAYNQAVAYLEGFSLSGPRTGAS